MPQHVEQQLTRRLANEVQPAFELNTSLVQLLQKS
jgi:hypothetical protein